MGTHDKLLNTSIVNLKRTLLKPGHYKSNRMLKCKSKIPSLKTGFHPCGKGL